MSSSRLGIVLLWVTWSFCVLGLDYQGFNREISSLMASPERASATRKRGLAQRELNIKPGLNQNVKVFWNWYYAHFFFDKNLISADKQLLENSIPGSPSCYDRGGQLPFLGYLKAREFLTKITDKEPFWQITAKKFLAVFSKTNGFFLRKNYLYAEALQPKSRSVFRERSNSEETDDADIGKIRAENTGEDFAGGAAEFIFLKAKNPQLSFFDGRVWYSPLSLFKDKHSELSPKLFDELSELARLGTDLDSETATINALRKRYVQELVSQTFLRLQDQLKAALLLKEADQESARIESVGRFYYDLLTIHPFINGNGRSARIIVEMVFASLDMFAPIYTEWGVDVYLSVMDFLPIFAKSYAASRNFHAGLLTKLAALPKPGVAGLDLGRFFDDFAN